METSTYTTIVLKASEGYMLTLANISIENAIITDKVYLAALDSPDNWKEITIEEADMIKLQLEVALKEATSLEESNMI